MSTHPHVRLISALSQRVAQHVKKLSQNEIQQLTAQEQDQITQQITNLIITASETLSARRTRNNNDNNNTSSQRRQQNAKIPSPPQHNNHEPALSEAQLIQVARNIIQNRVSNNSNNCNTTSKQQKTESSQQKQDAFLLPSAARNRNANNNNNHNNNNVNDTNNRNEQNQSPEQAHQSVLQLIRAKQESSRPSSSTRRANWDSQGLSALEKMRDRLVEQKSTCRDRGTRPTTAATTATNATATPAVAGTEGGREYDEDDFPGGELEHGFGLSPSRHDQLKNSYHNRQETMRQGLLDQLKTQKQMKLQQQAREQAEHEMMMENVRNELQMQEDRKRRQQKERQAACEKANAEVCSFNQKRKSEAVAEMNSDRKSLDDIARETKEQEEKEKQEKARKKLSLRSELKKNADNAETRRENELLQRQQEEAEMLDTIQRDLYDEKIRRSQLLKESWDRHKSYASNLIKTAETHKKCTDANEKSSARALADAAKEADVQSHRRQREEHIKKSTAFREGLLNQIRTISTSRRSNQETQFSRERSELSHDLEELTTQRQTRLVESVQKQEQLRNFLELQMQVDSLKNDQDDQANTNSKLKARRTMHDLDKSNEKWNEMSADEYYTHSKYGKISPPSSAKNGTTVPGSHKNFVIPSSKMNPSFAAAAGINNAHNEHNNSNNNNNTGRRPSTSSSSTPSIPRQIRNPITGSMIVSSSSSSARKGQLQSSKTQRRSVTPRK